MTRSKKVRLGDYIIVKDETNVSNLKFPMIGINRDKDFMPTVANVSEVDIRKYKIVRNGFFVFSGMQTGRDVCIRIGLYTNETPSLISPAYTTFVVDESKGILSEFFFMYFNRFEMDRYGWFISDSSVRSNLDWPRFLDIEIPKPSIDEQKEAIAVWKHLRKVKEENEALAEPLFQLCQSKIQELKNSIPLVELRPYIKDTDERNSELKIKLSQGISNLKEFQDPKQVAQNSHSDKIVRTGWFAYNRATTRNGEKISIAYREGPDCTVSSAYQTFIITDESKLNPYYLWMWFRRPEFDRYARYMSKGSAHEFFEFEEMQRVRIPLPDIKVQKAIVDIFNCAQEAKRIAAEADKLSREICPALMQKVINS